MKPQPRFLAILLAALAAYPACGATGVALERLSESEVDARALTIDGGFGQAINGKSFQQDILVSHRGHQYLGYYDADRRVCLARRALPSGPWEVIRFPDYNFESNDAHNTISVGLCVADGTIHLAFDHHGHPLHYRVSRPGVATEAAALDWSPDLFGPIRSSLEAGPEIRITYPRFIPTPDGGLQFCYRRGGSGNGDRMLVDYDPVGGAWSGTRQIDSGSGVYRDAMGESDSRCSYPNGYDYGPRGRLHATWVWRESAQGANHDLAYAWSDDGGRRWRNSAGEVLDGPPSVESPGLTAVPISRDYGLMNTHGQAVDTEGRIHAVLRHCTDESLAAAGSKPGEHRWGPPEANRYFHYWRADDGAWHRRELPPPAGSRPKLFMTPENDAIVIVNVEGRLHLYGATASALWEDWRLLHAEPGYFVNEMLGDPSRWRAEGVLYVVVQDSPAAPHAPTSLRVIDFATRPRE